MSVMTRYLNRILLIRVLGVSFIIIAFAMLFDLLDVSDDLLRLPGTKLSVFGGYVLLRLPSLLTEILPFATLVAGLFTAADLLRNSEMVVFWSTGQSPLRLMLRLAPAGLLLLCVKLVNDDIAVPKSVAELRTWAVGAFKPSKMGGRSDYFWLEDGTTVLRLPVLGNDTDVAEDVRLFVRDDTGNLVEQIAAGRAHIAQPAWRLEDVTRYQVGSGTIEQAELDWPIDVPVDKLTLLSKSPPELNLFDLVRIVVNDGYGIVPAQRYQTRMFHRVLDSLVPMLMAMLAFALARRFNRGGSSVVLFIKGLALGFVFVILNGMMLALGEAGLIAPLIATTTPVLVLVIIVFGLPCLDYRPFPGAH